MHRKRYSKKSCIIELTQQCLTVFYLLPPAAVQCANESLIKCEWRVSVVLGWRKKCELLFLAFFVFFLFFSIFFHLFIYIEVDAASVFCDLYFRFIGNMMHSADWWIVVLGSRNRYECRMNHAMIYDICSPSLKKLGTTTILFEWMCPRVFSCLLKCLRVLKNLINFLSR